MAGKSLSRAVRKELLAALRGRYARASKIEKGAILDEFVALSGYNRKYATRILGNAASPPPAAPTKSPYRIYDEAVKESLIVLKGGSRSDLGQTLASDIAQPDRITGRAWPPTARSGCTQQAANNQPGIDRSDAQTSAQDRRQQPTAKSPPPQPSSRQSPDPDLGRLAWPPTRLSGNRSGGPLWRQHGRELHPIFVGNRRCHRLGGGGPAIGPRADAGDRGAGGYRRAGTVSNTWTTKDNASAFISQTLIDYCQQRGDPSSPAPAPTAPMTRPTSSRRTAP